MIRGPRSLTFQSTYLSAIVYLKKCIFWEGNLYIIKNSFNMNIIGEIPYWWRNKAIYKLVSNFSKKTVLGICARCLWDTFTPDDSQHKSYCWHTVKSTWIHRLAVVSFTFKF